MPPLKKKEGVVVVLDIGKWASNEIIEDGLSFLEISKKCIERIVLRRIFSTPNDEIALVLVGSDNSNNTLKYSNISEGFQMNKVCFDMVKNIRSLKGSDIDKYDWIEGLVVAMNIFEIQSEVKNFTTWKIVTFVNLDQEVRIDKLKSISKELKENEIEVIAIGRDLFPPNHPPLEDIDMASIRKDIREKSGRERGEAILKYITLKCDGVTCDLMEAFSQLKSYNCREVKPLPWNATLDIGSRIKIPVAVLKTQTEGRKLSTVKKVTFENPEKVFEEGSTERRIRLDPETLYMKPDRKIVHRRDRIKGYRFGSSIVPCNEFDVNALKKKKTSEKSFKLLGVARRNDVRKHLLFWGGGYRVVPQKKFPKHRRTFSAFVHALVEQHKVVIATRVYRKGCKPKLVVLLPTIDDDEGEFLDLVHLPFSENVRDYTFPNLFMDKHTDEELAVVDKLIDAMDLSSVHDGTLYLDRIEDPNKVHKYNRITHRALHPSEPLPPVSEEVKKMLACPFESNADYKAILEVVKLKFGLVETKKVSKRKALAKPVVQPEAKAGPAQPNPVVTPVECHWSMDPSDKLRTMRNPTLEAGGLIKPHEDFVILIERGVEFVCVCRQMQKAILKLVLNSFANENFDKALRCLSTMRTHCIERNPLIFNDWLPVFKTALENRDLMTFWKLIVKDKLGLISSEESHLSSLPPEEARKFSEQAVPEEEEKEMDEDLDGLFDDLF